MALFSRRVGRRAGSYLNERGQGMALLMIGLALLFLLCLLAKGRF